VTDTAFAYDELPAAVQAIARPFYSLFYLLHDKLPEGDAEGEGDREAARGAVRGAAGGGDAGRPRPKAARRGGVAP
jgi:hypothetical protein